MGLLENAYETALAYELKMQGLSVKRQLSLPLKYKEVFIENAYRIDLIVEDKVIVEIKSVLELHPIFLSQVLTYLKQTNINWDYLLILIMNLLNMESIEL